MATGRRKSARVQKTSESTAGEASTSAKTASKAPQPEDDGKCPVCRNTDADATDAPPPPPPPVEDGGVEENWVKCDACAQWHHWRCVKAEELPELETLDKWYCKPCLAQNPKRTITVRGPTRKSTRTKKAPDYGILSDEGNAGRWQLLMQGKTIAKDSFRRMPGGELTLEWLEADPDSLKNPIIVETPDGLGMKMPPTDFSVDDVAEAVGENTPVEVVDVATQSNCPGWTLGKWAEYYGTPAAERDKIRNVISLEISGTPLADQVLPPRIVRELDWVEKYWPSTKRGRGHSYPKVQLYCLMGCENAWTDWHVDFAGSSVYYHIVSGSKVFYFIRPTPANLAAYERWSGTELQNHVWLGDMVDEVVKVELVAGNTMIIPTGWIHAVYTPIDTLVFGGNFLHSYNIATQIKICEIETRTGVPKKFRFPHFTKLCWYVAEKCVRDLKAKEEFPPRVMESLEYLAGYLVSEARSMERGTDQAKKVAKEHVPGDRIKDPAALAREFRWRVRLAAGFNSDDEGPSRRKGKAQAAAVAEAIVNGNPNGPASSHSNGNASKRKREEDNSGEAAPASLFRNFKPKAWLVEHETRGEDEPLVRRAPRPDPLDDQSLKDQWNEWKEEWEEAPELEDADVSRRRDVLVRARRTADGIERQRIERTYERWSWRSRDEKGDMVVDGPGEVEGGGPESGHADGMVTDS